MSKCVYVCNINGLAKKSSSINFEHKIGTINAKKIIYWVQIPLLNHAQAKMITQIYECASTFMKK